MKVFHNVLVNAAITINEADIETLEAKPLATTGGTGARTTVEEKQLRLGKRNLLTMTHLTMAFGSEALLNKIASVSTTDWPGVLVYRLIDVLKEKCAPIGWR